MQIPARKAPVLRYLRTLVAGVFIAPATTLGGGPSIGVMPVTVQLAPGQMATTLTVSNQGDRETAFQVRAYAWTQTGGSDQLTPTTELLASPPLGTIPAGGKQIMRLMLRRPAQGHEASYRILLDQIPPPAEPGTINLACAYPSRFSLPRRLASPRMSSGASNARETTPIWWRPTMAVAMKKSRR